MNREGSLAREFLLLLCKQMTWFRWAARSLGGGWFNGWRDSRREAAWCACINITIVMRIVDSLDQIWQCESWDITLDNRTRNCLQTLYKRIQASDTGRTTFSFAMQTKKLYVMCHWIAFLCTRFEENSLSYYREWRLNSHTVKSGLCYQRSS